MSGPQWPEKRLVVISSCSYYESEGELRLIPVTKEMIRKNVGILGMKGNMLKTLMEEKEREREQ